jgi:hypothetical protein
MYPDRTDAGYWKTDFFTFWNTLQTIKRRLDNPSQLVYVLGGVNPLGVERGSLLDQPNPLFETRPMYLPPLPLPEASALMKGLGGRMGLRFEDDAVAEIFNTVGGQPLLLRKVGSAIHESDIKRSASTLITAKHVRSILSRHKRYLYSHIIWVLDQLKLVAPEEDRLLRDIATGGEQAYLDVWADNEYRDAFAYHLERYGLIRFEDDIPKLILPIIRDALRKPVPSEFAEQKRQLRDLVDGMEQAIRARIASDIARTRDLADALEALVRAIPSDAKNRPMTREQLLDVGQAAGLEGVLESLNWGDYELILAKFYNEIQWIGPLIESSERMRAIKQGFAEAHLVRHNNDRELKQLILKDGFVAVWTRLSSIRDSMSG